ncbi:hypothetical protein BDN72DRAFT_844275 [Pluteus cervinus]|uniref:Uncharacterized protein n=1 Tax=Pluteus cervinus TaxID=181527 RepID=A0ACD3ALR9_9AGAR|nr:hypothetical protein BDN72DRAFT_844275 [Pluteus cervinus]
MTDTNAPPQPAAESPSATPAATTSTGLATLQARPTSPRADAVTPSQPNNSSPQPQHHEREGPIDPRVSALRAMFPDFDDIVLLSVLESVDWDQDRAINTLLGMSDPNYKEETRHPEPVLSQTELDEQFARRLLLEDQRRQNAFAPQPQRQSGRPFTQAGPFQPQPQPQAQYQQPGQEGNSMAEFQDQVSKFAETGKKTLGSLFSKVKAKIQELDSQRTGTSGAPAQQQQQQQQWGQVPYNSYQPPAQQQPLYYQPEHPDQGPPSPPIQLHGPESLPAFYDPNSAAAVTLPVISGTSARTSQRPASILGGSKPSEVAAQSGSAVGYDVSTPPSNSPPRVASTPSSPPKQIDGVKLGLLPKRPVSLLRPKSPGTAETGASGSTAAAAASTAATPAPAAAAAAKKDYDSDDGLEYAENPFEEGH